MITATHPSDSDSPTRWRTVLRMIPSIYFALLILIIALGIFSPLSVAPSNLLNLVRQGAIIGLVAIGQTVVLISGGLDLSVGSVVILANVLSAQLINGRDGSVLPVVALVLGVGALIGLINAIVVTRFRVTPFIATLGMNFVVFGIALVYSGGSPGGDIPDSMRVWGNGFVAGVIPMAALVWVSFTVISAFLLTRTTLGRQLIATGANPQAARLSGVSVRGIGMTAYLVSGLMAAGGGLMLAAFIGVGTLEVGTDFLLASIAAAVIGGTPFEGGRGTLWGTFGGVLFLMVLYSILTVLALPTSGRRIAEGLIILIALAAYGRQRE